jgi:DNA-binding transcriptional ArsR family regulator
MKHLVDLKKSKKAALNFRAINHYVRLEMLNFIKEKNKATVTEIYIKLKMEQSVISQHLAILRLAKIVNTNKQGKFVFYSINDEKIKLINLTIDQLTS